jgi:hypothetical protein
MSPPSRVVVDQDGQRGDFAPLQRFGAQHGSADCGTCAGASQAIGEVKAGSDHAWCAMSHVAGCGELISWQAPLVARAAGIAYSYDIRSYG